MTEIEVKTLPTQKTLYLRAETSAAQLAKTLGELLPRVYQQAMYKGAGPGKPYVRYLSMDAKGFVIEVGVPIQTAIPPEGSFLVGELGGPHAQLVFVGPYDRLREAHERLVGWCQQNKKKPNGPPLEVYLTDPADQKDPAKWETWVLLPVA